MPIGSGFGTSAAGALGAALAMSKALELNITYNDLGRIAHAAEVRCKTGLGTVGPIMLGGCILSVEPGAPGKSIIDRIPTTEDHIIIAGYYGPIPTKSVLSSPEKRATINKWGKITLIISIITTAIFILFLIIMVIVGIGLGAAATRYY